jgi:hypothetical protein
MELTTRTFRARSENNNMIKACTSVLTGCAIAFALVFGLTQPSAANNNAAGRPIALHLTASQSTYSEGQPILLKVEAVNESPDVVAVRQVAPWHAVTLTVMRDGAPIKPTGNVAPLDWRFGANAMLKPGQSYVYRWRTDSPTHTPVYFNALSYWGYPSLPPGHYTIVASPSIVSVFNHGRPVGPDAAATSNSLNIVIAK